MKVLFYTREYPPHVYGGAGVHVEYLTRELSNLMEVEVRCFGEQDLKSDQLRIMGFKSDPLPLKDTRPELAPIFTTLNTCIQMNSGVIDADIVHCHTWYAQFAGIISKLCYGTPLILTTHSLEPLRPWKREQLGRGYDASSWIEKTAIEMADAIIAVSEETKRDVLTHFNVEEKNVHVIYNGIDLKEYNITSESDALDKYGIDKSRPYLLFVGRITRQKGIIHLVNAIKYLNKGTQVVLCAGAPDTEEIGIEMKQRVEEVQKERDSIIWISEMLNKRDVIQLYSHAAVFCCPSIYEPFGIINIEAMACNTPVVASSVGGIKEVVVNEETGILIPLEQEKVAPFEAAEPDKFSRDLAAGINRLMNDEPLRKKMGANGRKRVEQFFDWKAIAKQTEDLYKSILNHDKR
jgi:glycogen synthase